jgi:hypothetical protein
MDLDKLGKPGEDMTSRVMTALGPQATLVQGTIPKLAKGALAMGPTIVEVGEGSTPELIAPMPAIESLIANAGGGGGGKAPQININNYGPDEVSVDTSQDAFGETVIDIQVARSFARDQRANGPISRLQRAGRQLVRR